MDQMRWQKKVVKKGGWANEVAKTSFNKKIFLKRLIVKKKLILKLKKKAFRGIRTRTVAV